uniref:Uncharacterized protein n=1 Tax=Rangifer tarandus platyrhynchus TaxID=3082113 RepID=A0ACB0E556_RANTA|nr:unnamed protein product [Rangifer tarandus platyrhynchus]
MRWRLCQNRAHVLEGTELDSEPKGATATDPGPFPGELCPRGCRPPVCSPRRPSVGRESTGSHAFPPMSPPPPGAQATPGSQRRPAKSGDHGSALEQAATAVRALRLPKGTNQRLTHRRNSEL